MFVCATSGSRVVEQRFSGARKGRLAAKISGEKDGPGGARTPLIRGLTTTEEWLMWIVFHALCGDA